MERTGKNMFYCIMSNWKLVFLLLAVKVIWFYSLVDVGWQGIPMVLLTFAFLAVFFDSMRRGRKAYIKWVFFVIYALISVLMVADVMYYNYFLQYTSVNQIFQLDSLFVTTGQIDMGQILTTTSGFLLLFDIPFVFYYYKKASKASGNENKSRKKIYQYAPKIITLTAIFALPIMGFNPLDDVDISSINHVEFFSYHVSDLIHFTEGVYTRASVDKEQIITDIQYNVPKTEGNELRSVAKGKNLIVIQMESFQDFPIGRSYNGQVLTPNINDLLKEDTLYFSNYYQTLGKGNTSDAEFATLNSFYPSPEREAYRLFVDNDYNGLPWLMRSQGYKALAFHGNTKTFWNREEAYKKQGFEKFYSKEELKMTEESGFGLTDKELFKQAVDILKKEEQPTFSFMVTLTNHIPYELDPKLVHIELKKEDEGTLFGHYMQSVRYADEAIGELIDLLKQNDMYENTVIAMYGDHHGMLNEYPDVKASMEKFLGREYDYDEMLHIPLLIHMPGSGMNKTIETVGGQVDFLPTISNLMGIDIPQPYIFGKDLINAKEGFLASVTYLLPGSFIYGDTMYQIGRDGSFTGGHAWSISTGNPLSIQGLEQYQKRAAMLVELSQTVLKCNLMTEYPGQKYIKQKK